ncbi:hypothetical protein MASR1M104_01000 [Cloacibacterium normanense]
MKKILFTFFAAFSGLNYAQETIPMYQQYLFDSEFLFNPAHIGKTDDVNLVANYQKQFSKFDESPNVQSVGIHANAFDRVGIGAYFFMTKTDQFLQTELQLALLTLFHSVMKMAEKTNFLSELQ